MKHFFLLTFYLAATNFVFAQVPLDTVFVSKKKSIESNYVVRYYYYPNLQVYFDTESELFIFQKNNLWITSQSIPANYRGYGLYNNFFVVIKGYTGDNPYVFIEEHRKQFPANFGSKKRKKETSNQLNGDKVVANKYL